MKLEKLLEQSDTYDPTSRAAWDSKLEYNWFRKNPKTPGAAFLATMLEAGGDIWREMTGVHSPSTSYILEKMNRIQKSIKNAADWEEVSKTKLFANHKEEFKKVANDINNLEPSSEAAHYAKNILLGIIYKDIELIQSGISKLGKYYQLNEYEQQPMDRFKYQNTLKYIKYLLSLAKNKDYETISDLESVSQLEKKHGLVADIRNKILSHKKDFIGAGYGDNIQLFLNTFTPEFMQQLPNVTHEI